jgi:hypothetical protein
VQSALPTKCKTTLSLSLSLNTVWLAFHTPCLTAPPATLNRVACTRILQNVQHHSDTQHHVACIPHPLFNYTSSHAQPCCLHAHPSKMCNTTLTHNTVWRAVHTPCLTTPPATLNRVACTHVLKNVQHHSDTQHRVACISHPLFNYTSSHAQPCCLHAHP